MFPAPSLSGSSSARQNYRARLRERLALVDGKLYMFADLESRKNWKKDITGNIARASEQWTEVSKLVAQNR